MHAHFSIPRRGQSLAEIIVAVGIAAILVGTSAISIATVLRSNVQSKRLQAATTLAQELSDSVRSFAEAGWPNIANLNHGSGNLYTLNATTSPFTATAGTETVTQEGVAYTRSFYVDNVSRDLCGAGSITTAATTTCASGPNTIGVTTDPSTQLVTIVVTWPAAATGVQISEYLTRSRNQSYRQTDWSGGGGQEGPVTAVNSQFASSTSINYSGTQGSIQLSGSAPYPASGNLYSSVFDTGVSGGVILNTLLWQGSQPTGTSVLFQIGSSNCANGATNPPGCTTGTWSYLGPDGSATTYYSPGAPNISILPNPAYHNNQRYFRYKAILQSDSGNTSTPRVDDVVMNWSP